MLAVLFSAQKMRNTGEVLIQRTSNHPLVGQGIKQSRVKDV